MADIVNLRQARKKKARRDKEEKAAENRAAFGRSKSEKQMTSAEAEKAKQDLDGHRLTDLPSED